MTSALVAGALETALAAVPARRDFSFSADLRRAAWITDGALEWAGEDGAVGRAALALPPGTQIEHLDTLHLGLCRPTDAGVELLGFDMSSSRIRRVGALATPRTGLLSRRPGEGWQYLAVTGFDDDATLWRVDWDAGRMAEAGRLPAPVDGGLWLDDNRLAVNLKAPSGRTSAHILDFAAGSYHRLFEVSPDSDDRVVLFHAPTGLLVVTSDAFGYPAVGLARLGHTDGVRFLPPLGQGEEAGEPCALLDHGHTLLLRHEDGVHARLRLANTETLEVSAPLPLPDGEVGQPVATDGRLVRFPFSAPDLPWRTAAYDLDAGRFHLDAADDPAPAVFLPSARATSFAGPAGPMPALVHTPAADAGDLVVVALHGGPIARWSAEYKGELALFTGLGIPVVALNYPGSTGSGHRFMRSLFGRAGSLDVEATSAVVDALAGGPGVSPEIGGRGARRVVLYGESYGAFLALATAAVRPVAGVAVLAPFASFSGLHASGSPEVRKVLQLLDGGNPLEFGRNLLESCRTIRGKVLIAHGTADRTVPIGESRELARALRDRERAGEDDVRLVELDGQGHELSDRHVLNQWYREIAHLVASIRTSGSPAQRANQ